MGGALEETTGALGEQTGLAALAEAVEAAGWVEVNLVAAGWVEVNLVEDGLAAVGWVEVNLVEAG